MTEAGLALGTAHYFSPEQAKGERVVPQSDIYAVGVTLYEMLTGRLPFESDSIVGLAYKHIGEPPVPPIQMQPNIPPRLNAIVLKAMAKDPQERFGSAAEMEKALRNLEVAGRQATTVIPVVRPNVAGGNVPRASVRGTGSSTGGLRTGALPAAVGGGSRRSYKAHDERSSCSNVGSHASGSGEGAVERHGLQHDRDAATGSWLAGTSARWRDVGCS